MSGLGMGRARVKPTTEAAFRLALECVDLHQSKPDNPDTCPPSLISSRHFLMALSVGFRRPARDFPDIGCRNPTSPLAVRPWETAETERARKDRKQTQPRGSDKAGLRSVLLNGWPGKVGSSRTAFAR